MGLCGCFGSGYHLAPGARAVLEGSCASSFGFPMGQVQAINSSRSSQEIKEPLVLEGLHVQGRGHSGKPLGSFSGLLCPMLGVFCPPWLRFLGSPDCVLLWSLDHRVGDFQPRNGERPQFCSLPSFTLRSFQGSLVFAGF